MAGLLSFSIAASYIAVVAVVVIAGMKGRKKRDRIGDAAIAALGNLR